MENQLYGALFPCEIEKTHFMKEEKIGYLNSITGLAMISDVMYKFFNVKFGYCIVLRYVFQLSNEKNIFPV